MNGLDMFRLLRVRHWIKNTVIFAAPLFALKIDIGSILLLISGFFCFSFLASAYYIINDVIDIESDRNHPVKQNRPLARGDISPKAAILLAVVLAFVSLAWGFSLNSEFGLILVVYAFLQFLYNWQLKNKTVLDILTIGIGFVLRALSGAVIVEVPASRWFLLCVGFLALFLGIEKRKAELTNDYNMVTRKVLGSYSYEWLQKMENVVTSAAVITYSLWTIDSNQSSWFLLTIPLVIFVLFRYQQLSETESVEAPEMLILTKTEIWVPVLLWGSISLIILLYENSFLF